MTYEYPSEVESRRRGTSLGAKVLIFGFAIFAVLGAFWTVVWFIRSYVEQPRIALRAPMALASRDSTPVAGPRESGKATESVPASTADEPLVQPAVQPVAARAWPAAPAAQPPADLPAKNTARVPASETTATAPLADRWLPADPAPAATAPWPTDQQSAPATAMAPSNPPMATAPTSAPAATEAAEDEIVASMEPAITGRIPVPRPKPKPVRSAKREAPTPQPRPEAAEAPSIWTAVPTTDDRFPTAAQAQPQPQ